MPDELGAFYGSIPEDQIAFFQAVAETARENGFKVKRDKVKHIAFTFYSSHLKQGIMRFTCDKGKYALKMKFFGVKRYPEKFINALKRTIEEFDFRYTGCYDCGKCAEEKVGYTIHYDNGDTYFRCGSEYIEIFGAEKVDLEDIKRIIYEQTWYYHTISGD